MVQEQAIWIEETWKPKCYQRMWKKDVPALSYEAEKIMRGWENTHPRSCTCEYRNAAIQINSLYDQHRELILRTAYPERYESESLQEEGPDTIS